MRSCAATASMRAGSPPIRRERSDIAALVDGALQRLGHVDILVNNAGATWGAPAEEHPLEAWDKVMNLNVRGTFLLTQAVGTALDDSARLRADRDRRLDRRPARQRARAR